MKKYLLVIITLSILSGCSSKNTTTQNIYKVTDKILTPSITYSDDGYKIYSFKSGINNLDLNFDNINDIVFVSHINGADYYDYHVTADRDIYNFFVSNLRDEPLTSYWNVVTKEEKNKKIDKFERDFVVPELLGCNSGGLLRIVQTKNRQTFLVLIDANPKDKDYKIHARFIIYHLIKSGEIAGSDNIFSFVREVVGKSEGCGIEQLGDKDIIEALKGAKL